MNNHTIEQLLLQIALTTTENDYATEPEELKPEPTPMPVWAEQFKLTHQFDMVFHEDPQHNSQQ